MIISSIFNNEYAMEDSMGLEFGGHPILLIHFSYVTPFESIAWLQQSQTVK